MFRNMVTSLFKHDRIKTTDAKAKELRRWADHIVTLAKRGDLHARRLAMSIVREKDVVHKIFEQATDRFGAINGGYTRIIKIGRRPGDAAAMTLVELISSDEIKPAESKPKPKTTDTVQAPADPVAQADAAIETAAAVDAEATETEGATAAPDAVEAAPDPSDGGATDGEDSPATDESEDKAK
jgi:large subunit ribosomal protein L17